MSILHIYDGNVYLAYGSNGKFKDFNWCGFPTGGIYALFKDLIAYKFNHQVVVFDNHSFKKDKCGYYKANRSGNSKVIAQSVFLQELLPKSGLQVFSKYGYEGDDLIYNIVENNYKNYDGIVIHTVDMDIAVNIDNSGKVKLSSPTTQSHDVNRSNYEYVVSKEYEVKFNTIVPFKIFMGDVSDNIPKVSSRCYELYNTYLAVLDMVIKKLNGKVNSRNYGSEEIFKVWFNAYKKNLTEEEIKIITMNKYLVYPSLLEEKLMCDSIMNQEEFVKLLNLTGMKKYLKGFNKTFVDLNSSEKKILFDYVDKYKKGFIAVDNGIDVREGIETEKTKNRLEGYASTDESVSKSVYTGSNLGSF